MAGLDDITTCFSNTLARPLQGVRRTDLDSALSYRSQPAIRADIERWEVEFPISNEAEFAALMAFWKSVGHAVPFAWTPPGEGSARAFVFEKFEPTSLKVVDNRARATLAYVDGFDLSEFNPGDNIVLITTTGIDGTIVGVTPILSVLQNVMITGMIVRPTDIQGYVSAPTISLGTDSLESNIFEAFSLNGMQSNGDAWLARPWGQSMLAQTGLTANLNISVAANATAYWFDLDLIGFAIPAE